ncbi:MAG TPA: GAF domain-containing protein [Cytophagales bacterium]|nr:GAF domain-containing protein [Cytophagales bacterium]
MKTFIEKNFINLGIIIIGILILLSGGLSFYNERIMEKALRIKDQSEAVKKATEDTYTNIRQMDVSLRGFAIIPEDQFFFYKIDAAKEGNRLAFSKLDELLKVQGYSDPENYNEVKKGMEDYIERYEKMYNYLKENKREEFIAFMRHDYGKYFWETYKKFADRLYAYEEKINKEAEASYQAAIFRNSLVQTLMIILGIPTLTMLLIKLKNQETTRKALLINLEENNRRFLFNPGNEKQENAKEILESSIQNLQKASDFVTQISEGNYSVNWEELNESNDSLNKSNLVGKLIQMREQMKKVKQEDEKRIWLTEGLAQFSDIIRNNQNNLKELGDNCLLFLVKYLQSEQGSFFILQEDESGDKKLNMISCYALNKKKFLEKSIELGEGILGQAFLEGETTMITKLPDGYTYINSGLGETSPSCLLIVPMKFNDEVKAIVEIASFHKFSETEINFAERAGEIIASAVANAENSEKTHHLLNQFKSQTEQLKAQEEELRQNMEEMEATQEEMRRKEQELESRIAQSGS